VSPREITHKDRVLAYLQTLAPAGATNAQITRELGIRAQSITYLLTQRLMYKGLIRGELAKGVWAFYALGEARSAFEPLARYSWELNRSRRGWQVRWLVPLLERPEGRSWLLREKLRCPCAPEEAAQAEVFHFCRPLGDLFEADYEHCLGQTDSEDAFIAYYNRLFGLPEDFGLNELWRNAPGGELRPPSSWDRAFLRRRVADKASRKRASAMARLLAAEVDLLLLTARHAVLIECCLLGGFSPRRYKRTLKMGELLARRLGKALHLGLVVDDGYEPPFEWKGIPYVRGSEVEGRGKEA